MVSAWGQSVKSATLDETGVQFQFGRASSGKVLTVYATHIGEIGALRLDQDGNAYLNLSELRPPSEVRACFFIINPATSEFVSMSSKEGFYNPLWEQRGQGVRISRSPRDLAAIDADEAQLDQRIASARADLARQHGQRYVKGQCISPPLVETLRPAYGFSQPGNYYYSAVRCAKVLEPTRLTCPALQGIMGAAASNVFASSDCPGGIADARAVIATGRDPATRTRHERIAADAAIEALKGGGGQHKVAAAQCIQTIAEDSASQIETWRNDNARKEQAEESAIDACRQDVAILADEQILRAEFAAERQRAKQHAKRPANIVASRQARDFACSVH